MSEYKDETKESSNIKKRSFGEVISDYLSEKVGSWPFIIIQATILVLWIVVNTVYWIHPWDPYPYILLNLVLSFQAAFTAPIIMMSQNRQNAIDRESLQTDLTITRLVEKEIREIHTKIDNFKNQEIKTILLSLKKIEDKNF